MRTSRSEWSLLYFVEPEGVQVHEAALVGDIVHREDAVGPFIVRACYCPETFLSGRVPDLQLHDVPVNGQRSAYSATVLEAEVHTDSGEVALLELVIGETAQDGRLAY